MTESRTIQVGTKGSQRGGNARLSVHHIGGRSGSRSFPILKPFEQDIVSVLYDADPECLEQVHQANERLGSELIVLPNCFAGSSGERDFFINYDPYTSSMLVANPDFAGWYLNNGAYDYILGEATRPVEERRVQTVTLDDVFAGPGGSRPTPDVLSIDTQGSELEILQGGTATLRDSVVAVVAKSSSSPSTAARACSAKSPHTWRTGLPLREVRRSLRALAGAPRRRLARGELPLLCRGDLPQGRGCSPNRRRRASPKARLRLDRFRLP